MKLTITEVPQPKPPRTVTVEMTEAEAQDIRNFAYLLSDTTAREFPGLNYLMGCFRENFSPISPPQMSGIIERVSF